VPNVISAINNAGPRTDSAKDKMSAWQMTLVAALFTFILVTLFAVAMGRGLSIDEEGFVATGALLAREGSLPYRDYPWFHTPNLPLLFALVVRASDHLLLSARAVSVLCTWALLIVVCHAAWSALAPHSRKVRFFLCVGVGLLLFSNPVTRYTCWRAWNHPPAVLLSTLAVICLWRAAGTSASRWWIFCGGFFVSLAVGTRLTVAPLVMAIGGATLLWPSAIPFRSRLGRGFVLAAGVLVGALPIFWALAVAPEAFVFDVFTWHGRISTMFREAGHDAQQITLQSRLLFPLMNILSNPGNLALFLLFALVQFTAFRQHRQAFARDSRGLLILASLGGVLIGVLAPSISYYQHYYALVPLLVLGLIPPLRSLSNGPARWIGWSFAATVAVSLASTWHDYKHLGQILSPNEWTPIKIHAAGQQLATRAGPRRFVTFAPLTPLEGGLRIHPSFATGPFGWKSAPFIEARQRREFGFVGPDEVGAVLVGDPMMGICTGSVRKAEAVLLRYTAELGYTAYPLSNGETAWIKVTP